MKNEELYRHIFCETFGVSDEVARTLTYQSISQWDSVGHMQLIAAIEDTFDIMMDTDDIIDFSSYEKGKEILMRNYHVEF